MLLFGVLFICAYLFDTLTQSRHALMHRHARQAFLLLVLAVYFMWFWVHGGQTLAMKTWHIKMVREDGARLTYIQALWRFVMALGCFWGLGYLYSLVDKRAQFAQDRLSKTLLISTKP